MEMENIICKDCKNWIVLQHDPAIDTKLISKRLCMECSYWHDLILLQNNPCSVRVEGEHYFIGDTKVSREDLKSGTDHVVRFFDGRLVGTNNLFYNGTVPKRYSFSLPDNAEFLYPKKGAVTCD